MDLRRIAQKLFVREQLQNHEEHNREMVFKERLWKTDSVFLAPSCGLLWTCQKTHSKELDFHLKEDESAF